MAESQYTVNGIVVYEEAEDTYTIEGVVVTESVEAAPSGLSIPIAAYHYNHHLGAMG